MSLDNQSNNPSQGQKLSTADMAAAADQNAATANRTQQAPNPPARPAPQSGVAQARGAGPAPLLASDEAEKFRARWTDIQATFVDQPKQAVEQADALVAELMKRLAETFSSERGQLEDTWSSGGNVSTEDLRLALQRYRSFFDRLLSV